MLKMPSRNRRIDHEVLTSDIKFGLGISPFSGFMLSGSQNYFELLKAANVYSVRRKSQSGRTRSTKTDRRKEFSRSNTFEGDKIITENKTVKKPTSQQRKTDTLPKPTPPIKPRIPVINIIRASNDSIPDLYISDSSDEDDDYYDDGEDLVYECPGLAASAEDMTVENPLFQNFRSSYRTPEVPKKYWKDVFVESV